MSSEHSLPPGVPDIAQPIFRTLIASALPSRQDMEDALDAYEKTLADSPIPYALALIGLSRQLLAMLHGGGLDAEQRCWVLAAVHYLVIEDDGSYDLDGFEGLEDDAAVLNAVAAALGRQDLCVPVD